LLKDGPKEQALWVKVETIKLYEIYNNKMSLYRKQVTKIILILKGKEREKIFVPLCTDKATYESFSERMEEGLFVCDGEWGINPGPSTNPHLVACNQSLMPANTRL